MRWRSAFRIARYGLFLAGGCMLLVVAVAYVDRLVSLRAARVPLSAHPGQARASSESAIGDPKPWKASRNAVARLRIPRLNLEVPVLAGTDKVTLNRGVGWIAGTSFPGEAGNIGIAGHRDSFFRPLENVRVGDAIELLTEKGKDIYTVDGTRIVSPTEVSVLQPRKTNSITLVTCYPFHFVGPAPNRYIVEASLEQ